ncbi:MAG: hypothetical protein K2J92_04370 [Muribaculaceae bacterium]|nr:hypothetical protein [Muribaculaceae bacterium]
MVNDTNNLCELLSAIDRYFDCLLSDDEEKELRKRLAETELSHPCIDETKAIMGFRAADAIISKTESKRLSGFFSYRTVKYLTVVAASVSLVVAAGYVFQMRDTFFSTGKCLAFVNGKCIRDEDAVMEIMFSNICELEQAADETRIEVLEELDVLRPVVEHYDSEFNLSDI